MPGCHATRATLAETFFPEEERWTILVDFDNGLNLVDRSRFIGEVREHFPQLSRWVETCNGSASNLTFWEAVLLSMGGGSAGGH